jgi:NAD(P)-dependent dehydrogenase (short-subunit alcohol dehydrogenase family)
VDVNDMGTFLTIKHTARIFIKEKTQGSIVMIASMSGQVVYRAYPLNGNRGMLLI